MVSTARDLLDAAEAMGIGRRLRAAGVTFLVDTCSYVAPVLRGGGGAVMTDSGKWAYYAPGNLGCRSSSAAPRSAWRQRSPAGSRASPPRGTRP